MPTTRPNRNIGCGIQYVGISGCTQDCVESVERLLLYHNDIELVKIYSHRQSHCIGIYLSAGEELYVKDGFGSGYLGEGSRGLSYVLSLFQSRRIEIEEYEISLDIFTNMVNGRLLEKDFRKLEKLHAVRPSRWRDYIFDKHYEQRREGKLWQDCRDVIPYSLIESRLIDLVLDFWEAPGSRLFDGYCRLESIVRDRTGLTEDGAKLFAKAFNSDNSVLMWKGLKPSERDGRANLFTSLYKAYRNPRAHQEIQQSRSASLSELMMLNHLYLLESESMARPSNLSSK